MPIRNVYLLALRTLISLQTATIFASSVTAGLMLTVRGLTGPHSAASYTLFFIVVAHVVAAALNWWRGHGAVAPMLSATGLLAVTLAQVALGVAHLRLVHVPLGVVLFGASVVQLVWVWHARPATPT